MIHLGSFFRQLVRDLRRCEPVVHRHRDRAEARAREDRLEVARVVAQQQRDPFSAPHAAGGQRARQARAARIQLAVGEHPPAVDQRGPLRVVLGQPAGHVVRTGFHGAAMLEQPP